MLIERQPFYPVLICSILAATLHVVSKNNKDWIGTLAMLASWIMVGGAFSYLIDYYVDLFAHFRIRTKHAEEISYEAALAEKLARLNSEQLEVFIALLSADNNQVENTENGIVINGISVPNSFIREMVSSTSAGGYLKPERDYSEGSKERLYYRTVVNYLVGLNLAMPARGNKPANVPSWKVVMRTLEGA